VPFLRSRNLMAEPTRQKTSADHAIAFMDAAAEANCADPFRQGLLIQLPAEGEVFVTGDLHGHRGNLDRIVQLANLPRYRSRHLVLQELVHELGTEEEVCRSYRLVETAARLKQTFPSQVHILLGNHEFAELLNLAIGKRGRELNFAFDEGGRRVYGDRWQEVREAYRRFWRTSPLAVRTENGVFISHSTPRLTKIGALSLDYFRDTPNEQALRRNGPVFDMLWGRDYRPEAAESFSRRVEADILIVGHTPCEDGLRAPNEHHVILDCKDLEGRYLLLPLDCPLTQQDVLARARRLYD